MLGRLHRNITFIDLIFFCTTSPNVLAVASLSSFVCAIAVSLNSRTFSPVTTIAFSVILLVTGADSSVFATSLVSNREDDYFSKQ